jgi:hypothetical protein
LARVEDGRFIRLQRPQRLIRGVELLVQVENEIERSGGNRDERAPLRHGVDSLALHVKALQQVLETSNERIRPPQSSQILLNAASVATENGAQLFK